MNRTLRVLNIEDSERDVALLRHHLSHAGYELIVDRVDTPAAMKAALETREWDVVLCDYSMPQFSALAALKLLKEIGLDIPFIIVSGTIGEEVAVEAMRAGAHGYLMKDNLLRLGATIERELHEAEGRRSRRRAEAALQESEDRYRDLVEHSHDLICTHDLEGRILSVNQAAARLLGYDRETLLGRNIRDALLPEFRDGFAKYIAEIQKQGIAHGMMTVQTRTGERRIWEYTNTLRSEDVAVPIVRGLARDVTKQKRAEEALRGAARSKEESLALLDTLLSTAPIGFAFHNRDLVYERINESLAAINGLPVEQHLGRTVREVLPEMAAVLEPHLQQVLEMGEPVINLELSGKTPAEPGQQRHWLTSFYPVRMQGGETLGVGVLVSEITERKLAEEALRDSEERYRLLFESNPHPMWVYDVETLAFLAVNEAAIRHYGYSGEEFLHMAIKDIRLEEEIPALIENVSRSTSIFLVNSFRKLT